MILQTQPNAPGARALRAELDSYRFHNSRYAWEQDRRREREAIARSDHFRRYSCDDVFADGATIIRELTPLLTPPPPPP